MGSNMPSIKYVSSFYTKLRLYCKHEEAQARKVLTIQGNFIISQILHL